MPTIIFDGKGYASKKELELKKRVIKLKQKGIFPKIASILADDNPINAKYVKLKKKAAERVGIMMKMGSSIDEIKELNGDDSVHGIMIQMPLPDHLKEKREEIVNLINPKKDVDGLRSDSPFLHPTSKAIIQILDFAKSETGIKPRTVCVVGATGMVGRPLVKELKKLGYKVIECDSKTVDLRTKTLKGDTLVSVTGKPGIIKEDMIKNGAIVIDVGYPKGDVVFKAYKKAGFITPVPGGVGPVTISCLLENLISAV